MKKKRVLSGLLAMVMAFSLTSTAFAKEIAPASDKNTIKKGEEVNVTLSTDEDITGLAGMTIDTTYDNSLFTYKIDETTNDVLYDCGNYETVAATVKDSANEQAVMNDTVRVNVSTTNAKGTKITKGGFVTLTFVAKEDVSETKAGEFKSTVTYFEKAGTDKTNYASEFPAKSISVTVTPASAEAKGYSMAVSGPTSSVVVGEDAQVSLKITNSDPAVTTYNAYYAVVTYDSDSLTYTSSNLAADAVDSSTADTLKIAGYGQDRACGTDNINLIFKTKKVGSSNVTVSSAKVDAKANASEKDAPAATLTTAEATITVGGYKVTLPDAFTGAGTVNPGETYTFTAKDISKKYDFTGSTMGGTDIANMIKDNGNGTYTIEKVTGELVIKATEKVSKVKINLSGDAKDKVTNTSWGTAAEVDAGTALWFMAIPDPGKELVVTVNGEVINGINMQAFMRYNIPAEMVKGTELNIVVNYKAENKITIIEKGDAWGDVPDETGRATWPKGGGVIDKPSAGSTYSLRFKLNYTKAPDDYIATINGKEMQIKMYRKGKNVSYGFDFDPAAVAVDGVITIDFSYKKTEPTYTVNVSKYLELDGQTMYLVTATGDVAEGKVLAYDGNQMYWSDEYNKENGGAYAWLIIPDETNGTKTPEDLKTEAVAAIKAVEGKKISIDYGGDVNLTKVVDINDAQFVWNMYNAEYKDDTTFQTVKRQKYLTADVNGDGKLNTTDAAAVVDIIKK